MPRDIDDLPENARDLIDDVRRALGRNQALWLQDFLTSSGFVAGVPFVGKDLETVRKLAEERGVDLSAY